LSTDTNIAPSLGWTFRVGIGQAIRILRDRFQEHIENPDDEQYFDQDEDGKAELKQIKEAMPLLDNLSRLYPDSTKKSYTHLIASLTKAHSEAVEQGQKGKLK